MSYYYLELACVTVIVSKVLVAVNTDTAWYKNTFHTHASEYASNLPLLISELIIFFT